jgi:hypothetical protein
MAFTPDAVVRPFTDRVEQDEAMLVRIPNAVGEEVAVRRNPDVAMCPDEERLGGEGVVVALLHA